MAKEKHDDWHLKNGFKADAGMPVRRKNQVRAASMQAFEARLILRVSLGIVVVSLMMMAGSRVAAAEKFVPDEVLTYKVVDQPEQKTALKLHIFYPPDFQKSDQRPAIVFFFGGGWAGGHPRQFYDQARTLAERGMVAISAEYRIKSIHKTSPFECVQDGKSAIRWVRQHAAELGVDPNRIVASGGSAGGHVAACTGVIQAMDEQGEDLAISSVPDAMILYNPVLDTTAKGFGLGKVGKDRQTDISPCHQVRAGIVPTLVLHGTADKTVPFENAERFVGLMKEAGNSCQLAAFDGQGHGFFNSKVFRSSIKDPSLYQRGMNETVAFLNSLQYLAVTALTPRVSHADVLSKPNIVVFLADDMGWGDAGCYGHPQINSPNIDKLASEGIKFTQCYAAAGVCSPSRSAILTGRTPYRNGVWRHLSGHNVAYLRASEITYPTLLKSSGYQTCHVGKWHLNSKDQFNNPQFPQPHDHGYDYWMTTHNNAAPSHENPVNFFCNGEPVGELKGFSAQLVAQEAIHWMKEIRDPDKPFALSVWTHEPHHPIATDQRFLKPYAGHRNRQYMGNISQLDHALGMVMEALEEQGIADDTLLIFTSDNGPEGMGPGGGSTGGLRGRKRDDHEGGIRVPGIVRWPGRIEPGTTSDTPVIGSDIFATALDAAGIPLPDDRIIDGASLLPIFKGQALNRSVPLFWRTHVAPPASRVAMRVGDWKLVADETLTKFQLYEIQIDWKEEHDRANEMPEKTAELKALLLETWQGIVEEGPNQWWETTPVQKNLKERGATLSY